MVKLLIIADDFTGALDTGIQFVNKGIATQVFTKMPEAIGDIDETTEVLVIDSETRPMPAAKAYDAVKNITGWAKAIKIPIIFKKTDSALRGNIGSELQAVLDGSRHDKVYFLPGYPKIDRCTVNGTHYIQGQLLEKSVFGQDPFEPVKMSYIPDIIAQQTSLKCACVKRNEALNDIKSDERIVICDVEKHKDIEERLDELQEKDELCIIAGCAALFETGIARKIGEKIGNSFLAKTERRFIVTVSAVCSLMSAFMSNNGTVAIWMPIIAIVAANSCGKIRSKMVIFPAGTAAIIGGACSLIGSTSQLAANSVLQGYAGYEEGMGMFDMTKIMFPAAVVQIIFWGTIGYKLLDKVLKPDSPDFDKGNMYSVAEIHKLEKEQESAAPAWKGYVALGTMILCIVLFVLSGFQPFKSYFNIGTIGLIGAAMVLGTGCISIKKAYSDLPWDVFVCIGTISGIGTGLDVSGGGALIANAVLNLFGGKNASVVLLTVVIAVLTSVLTNIMSNNATAAMLTPICIAIALSLGISPIPWVIVIGACSNLAIATSFGTAVNMQILPAGYKFSDFVKIGGPLLIILIAVVSICSVAFLF